MTKQEKVSDERLSIGVPGMDKMTNGGFIKGSVNLITGGPGTGKTIFGAQFLWEGITKHNENALFISLEQDIDSLNKDFLSVGMDFRKMEEEGKCSFIYFGAYSSSDLQTKLTREISRTNAKRVVIDSISVFAMALKNDYAIRKEIYLLTSLLEKLDCTVIMTSEVVGDDMPLEGAFGGDLSRYGVEEFVCDSVISVHNDHVRKGIDGTLKIIKMRRSNHIKDPTPYKITDKGMELTPKK